MIELKAIAAEMLPERACHRISIRLEWRAVTADTALRLERYIGWPAKVWLNLQSHHDPQLAKEAMQTTLAKIRPCPAR